MKERVPIRENLFREYADGTLVLLGAKCVNCGHISFPKREFCTECLCTKQEEIELSRCGTLHTFSILRVGDNHFSAPHPIGMVNLPERVRVTAPLVYRAKEDYAIGQTVEVVPDDLWEEEDKIVTGYRFRVVEDTK